MTLPLVQMSRSSAPWSRRSCVVVDALSGAAAAAASNRVSIRRASSGLTPALAETTAAARRTVRSMMCVGGCASAGREEQGGAKALVRAAAASENAGVSRDHLSRPHPRSRAQQLDLLLSRGRGKTAPAAIERGRMNPARPGRRRRWQTLGNAGARQHDAVPGRRNVRALDRGREQPDHDVAGSTRSRTRRGGAPRRRYVRVSSLRIAPRPQRDLQRANPDRCAAPQAVF